MKKYLAFVLVLLSGCMSSLDTSQIKTKHLDIAYDSESTAQKLDLYLPEGQGPFPVIIAIHGGGFISGDKTGNEMSAMLQGVKKGYAVASINYRLSSEAKFPAAIDDVQKAIVYLKENAKTYNLDSEKIALWGGSAGGHLASLAGTKGSQAQNTDVQAVVDWFGPINFATMDQEFSALQITPKMGSTNSESSAESKYLGKTIGTPEAEDLVKQANPTTYLSQGTPAFLIMHGTLDANIPITQSINFTQELSKVIGPEKVIFRQIEGAAHGGSQFSSSENLEQVFTFLDQQLGLAPKDNQL